MTKFPTITNPQTDEQEALPYKFAICTGCRGHGTSSAYLGAFTGEQMREDPDFAEDYRKGFYDRACDECGGTGKIAVADKSRMSAAQKKAWRAEQEHERQMRADEMSEYRMSAEYLAEIRGGY